MTLELTLGALAGAALLLVALSILWSTLQTGISPMPSSRKARAKILELAHGKTPAIIYELGSGFGTLAIPLARAFPNARVISYELSWVPWIISRIRAALGDVDNLTLRYENFLREDLSNADLFVCYLYPGAMTALAEKFANEPIEAHLITNTFALAGHKALETHHLQDLYRSPVYLYALGSSPPKDEISNTEM